MRTILVILLAVSVAGCGAEATSPEPTVPPVPPTATLEAPDAPTESPPPVVSPPTATPSPTVSPAAAAPPPSPSPTLVAGWPSVSRDGVTMAGKYLGGGYQLRLRVKLTGLVPGERVRLRATARYRVGWGCGACDYEGLCPFTDSTSTRGTATTTVRAVAGADGVASARITLRSSRPRATCPAELPTIWGSHGGRWTRIRVTDLAHLLRLTAPTQESYDIF